MTFSVRNCWRSKYLHVLSATFLAALLSTEVNAAAVAFEWDEGGAGNGVNSVYTSRHGVRGPVLADDFIPAISGRVTQVEWWGAAEMPGAPIPDFWELTFHIDSGGTPSTTFPTGVLSQHLLNAPGVDPDGDGVFAYSAAWSPQDLNITAGTKYWFSVANSQCSQPGGSTGPGCLAGWTWANAGGAAPNVGLQLFTGVQSIGVAADGGPHYGPWTGLSSPTGAAQNFAFRISVAPIPIPAALPLLIGALGGLGIIAARRRTAG